MLVHTREAFLRGHNRLATLPALGTLLDITRDLLAWQVEHDRPVDDHYLKGIFRLAGENWMEEFDRFRAALRPVISAVTETIGAGTLRLDIRIDGQPPGERPGAWYTTPRLHLLITGQDFVVPYGWEAFYELLGLFTLYSRHPEALAHGHQGARVMFSPPGHVSKEGFFGIDGLRIFLPAEAFETLVRELTTRCAEGTLAEALTGLRGLYGDL